MMRIRVMQMRKLATSVAVGCSLVVVVLLGGLRLWIEHKTRDRIYVRVEDVPSRAVAIVLGAGLWADGSLTPVLADRVATAADLYQAGAVRVLLFSGDNRFVDYNEPQAMFEYAVRLGVPEDAIVLDYAGRRTYDSCYRARAIFGVDRAVVVTQRFHAPRTLYLCDALGVDVVAAVADRQDYTPRRFAWETREYLALALAWWDVNVRHPVPVLGEPLPIGEAENGRWVESKHTCNASETLYDWFCGILMVIGAVLIRFCGERWNPRFYGYG